MEAAGCSDCGGGRTYQVVAVAVFLPIGVRAVSAGRGCFRDSRRFPQGISGLSISFCCGRAGAVSAATSGRPGTPPEIYSTSPRAPGAWQTRKNKTRRRLALSIFAVGRSFE